MTEKRFPLDENTFVCRLCRFDIVFGPHLEYEQHLFLALIASVSVLRRIAELVISLADILLWAIHCDGVYWNIQCLFASD